MTTTEEMCKTLYALIPISAKTSHLKAVVLTDGHQVVIGRDITCDLQINSLEISRRHAILKSEDNNWFITDLESTNGLYINGKPVIAFSPYCLAIGDKISFGPSDQSKVVFEFVDDYCLSQRRAVKTPKRKLFDLNNENRDQLAVKRARNEWQQLFDSELSCAICHELFITAVSLNCSHTFCQSCIEEWKHSNDNKHHSSDGSDDEEDDELDTRVINNDSHCCPVCRQKIVSQNRVLVLDNTIDYILQKWSPKLLEHRKQLIEERKQLTTF